LPDSQQRADRSPGGSCHGGPAPAGKGKECSISIRKDDEERAILICRDDEERAIPICKDDEERSIPTRKDDEVREVASSRSSRDRKEDKSQRLCCVDGSFMGDPV
jgi:hypothetical protein